MPDQPYPTIEYKGHRVVELPTRPSRETTPRHRPKDYVEQIPALSRSMTDRRVSEIRGLTSPLEEIDLLRKIKKLGVISLRDYANKETLARKIKIYSLAIQISNGTDSLGDAVPVKVETN